MKSFEYQIRENTGVSDRIAGLLVREAMKAISTVMVACNGKIGDAKRLFSVMAMHIQKGDKVSLLIEGEDEEKAALTLERFLHENL